MRVMVLVKATKESEAGLMPSTELLAAMGRFNEELVDAGIMQAGEGLKPSSHGKRVAFVRAGNLYSVEIAKRCTVELELDAIHMPQFEVPAGMTADAVRDQARRFVAEESSHQVAHRRYNRGLHAARPSTRIGRAGRSSTCPTPLPGSSVARWTSDGSPCRPTT